MKNKVKKRFIQVISLLMAFALSVSVAQSVTSFTGGGADFDSPVKASQKLTDVTGQFDIDGLKEQYFDKNIVKENTAKTLDERWVIVALGDEGVIDSYVNGTYAGDFSDYSDSYIGQRLAADMRVSHRRFLGSLDKKGIDYEFKYSYTALNNGVAIKVKSADIAKIRSMKGVTGVYYSEHYAQPETVATTNNANVYTTGIYDSSDLDVKGEGMVVAILDTGLDATHPAFSHMPSEKAKATEGYWTKNKVAEKIATANLKAKEVKPDLDIDEVYYNEKVPYAFDYADDDPEVYPSYSTHGTHVAGIVAGKDETKVVNGKAKDDPEAETFIGVAPEAQLVIMKVFTDDLDSQMLGGADTIDILAAVNDSAELGVDVINMSLGSSAGFSDEGSEEEVTKIYNKVEEAGISLVVAASNDYSSGFGGGNGTNLATNPDSGTVGSPSTYSAALSVASINGQKSPYFMANQTTPDDGTVAFITNSSDVNGNELEFVDDIFKVAEEKGVALNGDGSLTLKYVLVGGVGNPINYNSTVRRALSDGKTIALVKRGDITFAEKVQNAMANGAMAVVIYNNLSGTIRMSLGEVEDPVPTCSIGMDAGKLMEEAARANRSVGTVTFSKDYSAGPFMSDFSSWGPTPDLKLKPEITAHGGEITSAVPGGYDEYSGTSMASPNMAGAVALLRQHIRTAQPTLKGKALNARVNQMLMSTATIALNQEGNPYSPRKQGAGLAGIADAIKTQGYITVNVKNKENQDVVYDKTKLELGDDKQRTGVYDMKFTVNNITNSPVEYKPSAFVMTETLASDNKTVAEKAYMLADSKTEFKEGNTVVAENGKITVPANGSVEVSVKITLGADGKSYIENSFKNGMYVEGFLRLNGVAADTVALGVPFLAFYGDWNDAPLFDYTTYEIAENEADTSVDPEDKIKASSAASTPLGLYYDNKYIMPLGTYLYNMADDEVEIVASDERAAVSMYDESSRRTIYELYMVYAGLLRGAKTLQVDVVDSSTGELVYSKLEKNVRKAYAAGGSNRGSAVMLEMNPAQWGLNNNSEYVVTMRGTLDSVGGENPDKSTFTFKFAIDTQAPVITDYRVRFEPYTENKETKYRVYMDVDTYDNQYVQSVLPCYIKQDNTGNVLSLLTEFPIPVYSQKNTSTTVSFEITEFYNDYVKNPASDYNRLYVAVEDYAMNQTMYRVDLSSAINYPEAISVTTDDKLTKTDTETAADGHKYDVYAISMSPNEVYKLNMTSLTAGTQPTELTWATSNTRVRAEENELFVTKNARNGETVVTVYAGQQRDENILAKIVVTVSGNALDDPRPEKIVFKPVINGDGYLTSFDNGTLTLELNPNETVSLAPSVEPWYVQRTQNIRYTYTSSNPAIASIERGNITSHAKGTAYITVTPVGYERLAKTLRVVVGDDYRVLNYSLYDYYGGAIVDVPEKLNIMFLDEECFQNNKNITEVKLPGTLTEISKNAFKGCSNLKKITIPAACIVIGEDAFSGCTSLEEIVLEEFTDKVNNHTSTGAITVGRNAFAGCAKLTTIQNPERLTTAFDGAFSGCTGLQSINIKGLRVGGSNIFKGCTNLKTVIADKDSYIGPYMFQGCTSLQSVTIDGARVAEGAFSGCTNLSTVNFTSENMLSIGAHAFENTAISKVVLPNGHYAIGESAFGSCKNLTEVEFSAKTELEKSVRAPFGGCDNLTAFTVAGGNTRYSAVGGVLYNADKTAVELVGGGVTSVTLPTSVTAIGDGAFAGYKNLTEINLGNVTSIGAYAFDSTGITSVIIPSGVATLADGAFYNCTELSSVDLGDVTVIGKNAFYNCTALTSIDLKNVHTVDDGAFFGSKLKTVTANNLETVGAEAFRNTGLEEVAFGNVTTVGYRALANNALLRNVTLGAVTQMGNYAFANCGNLVSFTLGNGADAVIGNYAFDGSTKLASVTLSNSMRAIGNGAFFGNTTLTSIDLGGAKEIGALAFYGATKLAVADLSSVETIGMGAFAGCSALTSATLTSAKEIGENAFQRSGLETVTFPVAEFIGQYAFEGTKLTSVTIPATFDELTFDDSWWEMSEGGHLEEVTGKKTANYGIGAFSGIETLTEINVAAANETFFSEDGVLYARVADGYILQQFPAGKTADTYTVKAGTVRIADSAFEGAKHINKVHFPYTVKAIGSYAFFDCDATEYVFDSVEAPLLESSYIDPTEVDTVDLVYLFSSTRSDAAPPHSPSVFNTNFKDYVAKVVESKYMSYINVSYEAPDFGLKITRPENGVGYDTIIYKGFFSTESLSAYAADRNTRTAIDMLAAMPTADEIKAQVNGASDKLAEVKKISETAVRPVREQFNLVQDPNQLEFITTSNKLLAAEKTIRDIKSELGAPAKIESIVVTTNPDKRRYTAGETFDPTGMVISAIYDDASVDPVTGYTVDKTGVPLTEDDRTVVITYSGKVCDILISVTAPEEPEPENPEKPDDGNNGGNEVKPPEETNKGCGCGGSKELAGLFVVITAALSLLVIKRH